MGMDEAVIGNLVIISLILIGFGSYYFKSQGLLNDREELFERLEVLDQGMSMIGMFLEKIPEMQPNFTVNQNPLTQIMEMIVNARTQQVSDDHETNPILADAAIRDVQGRFTNATEKEQEKE